MPIEYSNQSYYCRYPQAHRPVIYMKKINKDFKKIYISIQEEEHNIQ